MKTTRFDLYTKHWNDVPAGHIILDPANHLVTLHKPYESESMQVYNRKWNSTDGTIDFPGHVIHRDERATLFLGVIMDFELTANLDLVYRNTSIHSPRVHDESYCLTFTQISRSSNYPPSRLQAHVLILNETMGSGKLVRLRGPGENGCISICLDDLLERRETTIHLLPLVADYTGRRSRPRVSLHTLDLGTREN